MTGRACAGCGSTLGPGDAFCTECGAVVQRADSAFVTCPSCHAATPASMTFCTECGIGLEQERLAAPTQPVPVAPPLRPRQPSRDEPKRSRRGLLVGVAAAVLVLALGAVGVTYVLRSGNGSEDEPVAAASKQGTSATPASTEGPATEAVAEARRARFRLVVVGCPRGAVSDAVSVGDGQVLVPVSVVKGASKILLTGTARPEPAYVLGRDEDSGVAVLKVPALADQGGGTVAADDPADGTRVVVVGASEGDDVPATVTAGEDGTRVHADRELPLGGVLAGKDGHVVGIVGPGEALVPASKLAAAKDEHADASPVELTTCDEPSGPDDATVLVAERPSVTGDSAAVVDRLVDYYTAVNQRQLRKAHGMRTDQSGYQSFADGFRTTYNVGMVIGPPRIDGDSATVRVSFTSTQNAEQSPAGTGQTCTRWKLTHGMDKRGGRWLVGPAKGSSYQACE